VDNILKTISGKIKKVFEKIPEGTRSKILLTGGSAAYLYGSDRPFSDDVDFIIEKSIIRELEKSLDLKFGYFTKKPVFHSFKAVAYIGKISYDFIVESIIQPQGVGEQFTIVLNDIVSERKKEFDLHGLRISCIPKELLVLMKLLAGRGDEVGKYDLTDVWQIVSKNHDFDYGYLKKLISVFCGSPEALKILVKNAKKISGKYKDPASGNLLTFLVPDRQAPENP
jgi:hypothetical protein